MGDLTEDTELVFEVMHQGERPYEFRDRVHWTIAYEMSLNLRTYDREVYHSLDWLGDMGGLYDDPSDGPYDYPFDGQMDHTMV